MLHAIVISMTVWIGGVSHQTDYQAHVMVSDEQSCSSEISQWVDTAVEYSKHELEQFVNQPVEIIYQYKDDCSE